MSPFRAFQLLALASLAAQLLYLALPYAPIERAPQFAAALELHGDGGAALIVHPITWATFLIAKFFSTAGLLLFRKWGRLLLVAGVVLNLAILPFAGVLALPPADNLVNALIYLLDGALIALSYRAPVNDRFNEP